MIQLKAFKFRIYPTAQQEMQLNRFFGAKRYIYNTFLHIQQENFKNKNKHLSHFDINKAITLLKQQESTSWLRDIDSILLQNAAEDLSVAYQNFFNSVSGKRKGPKIQPPTFKKKSNRQSYRTRTHIHITDKGIKLPKIKTPIKTIYHQEISGKIKSATISKTPSGKYFVSILCETDIPLKPMTGKEVGIDLGITHIAILSDGTKFIHPAKLLEKANQQLKHEQKKLAKKKKYSKNYHKQRIKVAKKYELITNIRNDYYNNLSYYLVNNFDAIYLEDLNIKGMMKNRCLARKIAESSWGILLNMIQYKCGWYGKTYHKINRWTPTSKTCHVCNHKLDELKLSERHWTCPSCGAEHDRDINAAMNIKNTGQKDLYNRIISDAIDEIGDNNIPVALMKLTDKTEKSTAVNAEVGYGIEQATRSLVR